MDSGEFTKAIELLNGKPPDARAGDELREVMERIRVAYSTDADAMLAKVKRSIPDVDGRRHWSGGEKQGNCNPALSTGMSGTSIASQPICSVSAMKPMPPNAGRLETAAKNQAWRLEDHLAHVIAAAKESSGPEVMPVRERITYRLIVPANAPGFKAGALVRVVAANSPRNIASRKTSSSIRSSPEHTIVGRNRRAEIHRRRVPRSERSISKHRVDDPPKPMTFEEVFEFTTERLLSDRSTTPRPSHCPPTMPTAISASGRRISSSRLK